MTAVTFTNNTAAKTEAAQRGATALRVDAVATEASGLILLLGGGGLAEALGLMPISVSTFFGVFMLIYGATLWVLTSRWMGVRLLRVQAIGNVVWIVLTEALLLSGAIPFTGLGVAVLMAVNLLVLTFTVLQWRAANQLSQ